MPHGLTFGVSDAPRSVGLHLSDIYTDFYKALAGDDAPEGWPEEPLMLAAEGGFQLERSVEAAYQAAGLAVWRPEERRTTAGLTAAEIVATGGIRYSPDLFMVLGEDDGRLRIGEIKRKYMSSRDFPKEPARFLPQKIAKNVTQMKGYCFAESTTLVRYIVEFALGDYTRPYMPTLLCWDITFTERECEEEWAMLLNHARSRGMLR